MSCIWALWLPVCLPSPTSVPSAAPISHQQLLPPALPQADAEAAQKEASRLGAERNSEAEKGERDGARLRRMEEQLQVQPGLWACGVWACGVHLSFSISAAWLVGCIFPSPTSATKIPLYL